MEKEGITTLDTAEIYPGSEAEIGYHDATKRFVVDTKSPGAFGGDGRLKDEIVAGVQASLEKLKTKQVSDIWFGLLNPGANEPLPGRNSVYPLPRCQSAMGRATRCNQ